MESQVVSPLSQAVGPLTAEDARNLLVILNRSTFTGITEAQVCAILTHKLKALADGKDVPTAD